MLMEEGKRWSWGQKGPLLPTTRVKNKPILYSLSDGVAYLRHWFQTSRTRPTPKDSEYQRENAPTFRMKKKSASTNSFVPVAFPAYLNSSSNVQQSQNRQLPRKSSLLEGFEKTLELMSTSKKQTKLTFPKDVQDKQAKKKHSSICSSYLPVPLVPLPQFKVPSTLYGYLDEASFKQDSKKDSTKSSIIAIVILFVASLSLIVLVYSNFPEIEKEERALLNLPRNMEDAKTLGRILSKYKNTYYYQVMSCFFVTYVFLQTFAIPGSVFLSILSGFLYPFYLALFLVCLCSGLGATGCYMISHFVGKPLIDKYLADRVEKWNAVVDDQREHLFNYLLFLRITPFLPNWFINVVSPIIRIPISLFFVATFFGVAPLSFIAIQGGTTLYQLTTAGDAVSWTSVAVMGGLAFLSILPVLLKNKLKNKAE